MTQYPLYIRLSAPHGWSGQVWKISPPPGCDPQNIQCIASCYTSYATPDHKRNMTALNANWKGTFSFISIMALLLKTKPLRSILLTAAISPRQQHRFTHMLVSHRNPNSIATTFQCKALLHKEPLVTLYPYKWVNVDLVPFSLKFCSLVNKLACLCFCCLKATCHVLDRTVHF